MPANVIDFPGAAPIAREPASLHLSPAEVEVASGGYVYPARQLRELHARGFTRAYIPAKLGPKRVSLERGHYEAVISGQFGPAAAPAPPQPSAPNAAGLEAFLGAKKRRR